MKKILKIVVIVATLMMGGATDIHAQVFIMEDEHSLRPTDPEEVLGWPVNPQNGYGTGTDDYVPLDSGFLLLTMLGGLYLIRKKHNDMKVKCFVDYQSYTLICFILKIGKNNKSINNGNY